MDPTKPTRAPQSADKYILRFPPGMREQLRLAAEANGRSLNAELIARLQNSGQAQAPELAFLLARQEMRAAEAELDIVGLKSMLGEVAWCLKAATIYLSQPQFAGDAKLQQLVADWVESTDDAMYLAEEFALPETDTVQLGEQKIEAFEDATRKAQAAFDNLRSKRNELVHSTTPQRRINVKAARMRAEKQNSNAGLHSLSAEGSPDLGAPLAQGSSVSEDPSPAPRRINATRSKKTPKG